MVRPLAPTVTFTHSSRIRSESAKVHKAGFLPSQRLHSSDAQRKNSPDEYPFTTGLPDPILPPPEYPPILHPNKVNANATILSFYIRSIVPRVTIQASLTLASLKRSKGITGDDELEDDGNYGSAATVDVEVLHAISKRVHYGSYIPISLILILAPTSFSLPLFMGLA
jgi:chorismate mutase